MTLLMGNLANNPYKWSYMILLIITGEEGHFVSNIFKFQINQLFFRLLVDKAT